MDPIDLRSDTVTRPTEGMRRAMATAEVGDDQYGEDPSVRALEEAVAGLLGQEAAVFTPTGIMATQILLRALVPPGSEVVCEANAHVVAYEAGAAAINAQVQFRTVTGDQGRLAPQQVRGALRPVGFPNTEVGAISVEETTNRGGGAVHGLERLRALRAVADGRGVPLHGDGARLWNALAATGEDPAAVGGSCTALSVCLSKGLGAPVGSLAVGPAAVIADARVWRRRFGGAMRRSGQREAPRHWANPSSRQPRSKRGGLSARRSFVLQDATPPRRVDGRQTRRSPGTSLPTLNGQSGAADESLESDVILTSLYSHPSAPTRVLACTHGWIWAKNTTKGQEETPSSSMAMISPDPNNCPEASSPVPSARHPGSR